MESVNDKKEMSAIKILSNDSVKQPFYGFILAIFAAILNVMAYVFVKKTRIFNSFDILSLRYCIQIVILLIINKMSTRQSICTSNRANLKLLIWRGLLDGISFIGSYTSLKLIDPSDTISILATNIIFVVIFSRIFMKEKFVLMHFLALVLMICGILSITQPSLLFSKNNQYKMLSVSF